MSRSFMIRRESIDSGDQPRLMREVIGHTGSEEEASSILRSLERLGSDASIDYYEMTRSTNRQRFIKSAVVWSVRAVRSERMG